MGNHRKRPIAWTGLAHTLVLAGLLVAASPVWADRPAEISATAAAATLVAPQEPGTAPAASVGMADHLLELVVSYLDSAFDATRRAHRDPQVPEASELIASLNQ
jgi:hypothetical protein